MTSWLLVAAVACWLLFGGLWLLLDGCWLPVGLAAASGARMLLERWFWQAKIGAGRDRHALEPTLAWRISGDAGNELGSHVPTRGRRICTYFHTCTCVYYASQGKIADRRVSQVATAFREGTEAVRDVAILASLDFAIPRLAGADPTPTRSLWRTEGHRAAGHRLGCEVDG